MFPKSSGRGSTHTASQSHAHDLRRSILPSSSSREEAVVRTIAAGLRSMAHGEQIIHSPELTGATPNYKGAAPIGSSASDPTRVALASIQHESREHVKRRLTTYADSHHLPRSVSPEREPIMADGTGGGYSTGPIRVASPLPFIVGTTDSEKSAGESAWITAPFFPTSFASRLFQCDVYNTENSTYNNRSTFYFLDCGNLSSGGKQHRLDNAGLTRKIGTNQVRALSQLFSKFAVVTKR